MKKKEYIKMYSLEDSHFWFLGKRLFINSILTKKGKKKYNILDIGSGTGGITKYLEGFGKVTGIENNPLAVRISKERKINIILGDANNVNLKGRKFDLITFFDVLYHKNIDSETKVLKQMSKMLKPGGKILITDSAFDFLKSSHDINVEGKKRYTVNEISKLVEDSGFEIIKKSYIYMSIFPLVLVKRKIINPLFNLQESDVKELPNLINNILILLMKFEAFLLRYLSFPFGVSVLIFAKKDKNDKTK